MDRRAGYRLVFLLCLSLLGTVLVSGFVSSARGGSGLDARSEGETVAPPGSGVTVVTTDSNTVFGREEAGPRASSQLVAVGPDGQLLYQNDSHTRYWDVDPVEGTNATVEYVYADHLRPDACGGESVCTRNGVERVNLTTGDVTDVYHRITPGKHSTRWHDADRINETHVVVADIADDSVFVVDTETGIVEWEWNAQSEFAVDRSGGPYPSDWTHLNDVEVLRDGRIVASLRNHDQVVFLDRSHGVVHGMTLGSDDDYSRLYEQHNPDFIPRANGGPSLLVADSENHRVVEYRRTDGSWRRTWTWRDGRLQWPRDADRLPNGHTLVTDSNGDRVLEVDERGRVVWEFEVAFPYEAERLGTGDESAGGPASQRAGLDSAAGDGSSPESEAESFGTPGVQLGRLPNAVAYVLPVWMGTLEFLASVGVCLVGGGWAVVEYRWSNRGLTGGTLARWQKYR
jgi:hypothetical protein